MYNYLIVSLLTYLGIVHSLVVHSTLGKRGGDDYLSSLFGVEGPPPLPTAEDSRKLLLVSFRCDDVCVSTEYFCIKMGEVYHYKDIIS